MIRQATKQDIKNCLALVELVKDNFPGYEEDEFLKSLSLAIVNNEVILDEQSDIVVGVLSFSYVNKELTFLATHPSYRKQGIAKQLIIQMKAAFSRGDSIHVITFREGDLQGIAARKCYLSCGFKDTEQLTIFGYPCQKMELLIP